MRAVFRDCAPERPAGRRSTCCDGAAREACQDAAPSRSALAVAADLGIAWLAEDRYRHLQSRGEFDRTTSRWIATPATLRALGGALFGDRRYGRVFVHRHGAQSYFASLGFRGRLVA